MIDLNLECTILGNCLSDSGAMADAMACLSHEDFYHTEHQRIFRIACDIAKNGGEADPITVGQYFTDLPYLSGLVERMSGIKRQAEYCTALKNTATIRRVKNFALKLSEDADKATSAHDLITTSESVLHSFIIDTTERAFVKIGDDLSTVFDRLEDRFKGKASGISYGLSEIDLYTGGLWDSDLVILSGRPGMGKTTLIGHIGTTSPANIYIFETEAERVEMVSNMLYAQSGVESMRMRNGLLNASERKKLMDGSSKIFSSNCWINDTPFLTPAKIRSQVGRMIALHGKGVFCIDHLQNITVDGRSTTEREDMNKISWQLKQTAKEFSVPIIVLSHLKRAVEDRPDKRPRDSDLRESGAIEANADVILHMYRESQYTKGFQPDTVTEIGIGKNRHGAPNKTVYIYYDMTTGKIDNLDNEGIHEYISALKNMKKNKDSKEF